ncbi:hypothetical protein BDV26DRAFT_302116 [Aspergillus bertholletiae]|uniref:AMP dependent CoA ligase n=1 Tax=Aspergillus bertholletiae TaxID=1226010 RepID=A0A5N7AQU0_9EURO|nr:hypothetical protein BDV26DRAFT_302116 [Aspergillus bertholletiae]
MATIYQSNIGPFGDMESLSIPQFMVRYNPDEVASEKIVHLDTFSKDPITYGSLRHDAGHGAWGLRNKLNLQPGDILLALIPNSNVFVLLAHATWWAGAVFAPLNTSSTEKDIAHVINLIRPTHIATVESKLRAVQQAMASKFPLDVIGTEDQHLAPYDLQGKSAKETASTICFSSGTTGKMKGVLLSHYNMIMNSLQLRNSMPLRLNATVREVWFSPYCHIYGLASVVFSGMWVGALYLGQPAFELKAFCQKASEIHATDMHLVPPVAISLTSQSVEDYDLSSVQRVLIAAAPLKVALQQQLQKRFPQASICQGYGLTECSPGVLHQIDDDGSNCGSVGRLLIGTEARLVDPMTRKDVKPGEEGELWVRGPQVMMGYINDPASTKETFTDGWLRTGDILKIDQNGNFWITDRLKEIAPSELEDTLLRHPDVTDAAVCAVYDDSQATEVPLAYVSLVANKVHLPESNKRAVLARIGEWVNGQVAGYKKIRGGVFHLQEIPKTPTGKIQRRLLPAKVQERRENQL